MSDDSNSSATPAGVRVVAVLPNGSEHNITEGVQVLYDNVIQSMDWGSGFLTIEDVEPIVTLAKLCGFREYEKAEEYMAAELAAEKQRKCLHEHWRQEPLDPRQSFLAEAGAQRQYVRQTCLGCGLQRTVPR